MWRVQPSLTCSSFRFNLSWNSYFSRLTHVSHRIWHILIIIIIFISHFLSLSLFVSLSRLALPAFNEMSETLLIYPVSFHFADFISRYVCLYVRAYIMAHTCTHILITHCFCFCYFVLFSFSFFSFCTFPFLVMISICILLITLPLSVCLSLSFMSLSLSVSFRCARSTGASFVNKFHVTLGELILGPFPASAQRTRDSFHY